MKTLSLLIGDPGISNDPFGVVALQGTYPDKKIYNRHAIQFKKEPYSAVANHFSKMHKKHDFDMMILEKNFDYDNVSKAFSHLPIQYVTTSSGLSEETRAKGYTVDKPYMISWLRSEYKRHTVQYPPNQSGDMKELINQRNEIVGITAPSGHTSYKRQRNRHDDLFLPELIGCNAIRIWWEQQQEQ